MKRILMLVLAAVASYAAMVIGKLQEHPVLLYLGMTLAAMLVLGLMVWLAKLVARFIGWAMTSAVYLTAGLGIVGLLSWNDLIPNIIGYSVAMVFSTALCLVFIRRLARWAQKSLLWGEVFSFVSNYQLKSYINRDKIVDRETAITYNVDYKNIVVVLRSMDIGKEEAKEAAVYAIEQAPAEQPIEAKIKLALKYIANRDELAVRRN